MPPKAKLGEPDEATNGVVRISISVDQSTRRAMRVAAAHADMTVGEWSVKVLEAAANKATSRKKS